MCVYPFKFRPIFKERIWGGQKLRRFFADDLPHEQKIGEAWLLTDLPEDKSVISNGDLAGQTLNDVVKRFPEQITGDKNFKSPFPLLMKFLDAEDTLSVQVHPDLQTCQRLGVGAPKTECWYIMEAGPDSAIYKGLKNGVTKQQFVDAIENGTADEMLNKIHVNIGECHFLPAGTAHAISAGLLIAEIQIPSDTTYRVFDWNRVDDSGKPRQLHIKQALESIHFEASEAPPVTTIGRLVECEYFTIDKGHQAANCELLFSSGCMKTFLVIRGLGFIVGSDGSSVQFKAGDCILVPADYNGAARFTADTEYLTIMI